DCCPYCCQPLNESSTVVEHLDGMSRYRAGLHVPGNVLVACKRCNGEKRRDDCLRELTLANSGWESFLSHDGTSCTEACANCKYWASIWDNPADRRMRLAQNLQIIREFRQEFPAFEELMF